ncbi:MAG: hypothetical protein N0A00_01605 [Candidatus Bathyarchaeota archaeon]|nr:hypothetical protein [Candidatus Bathyarchaeota archaeon]
MDGTAYVFVDHPYGLKVDSPSLRHGVEESIAQQYTPRSYAQTMLESSEKSAESLKKSAAQTKLNTCSWS